MDTEAGSGEAYELDIELKPGDNIGCLISEKTGTVT